LYLFILYAEGLCALIRQAKIRGDLHDIQICVNASVVFHLLFADDCFLFFMGRESEAHIMKNYMLTTYEAASRQAGNLPKFEIHFSIPIDQPTRTSITQILGIRAVLGTSKYLGLPSMIGRSKQGTFGYIKDQIWQRINSWSSTCLSKAGHEIMTNSLLQAIPSYVMSIYIHTFSYCTKKTDCSCDEWL